MHGHAYRTRGAWATMSTASAALAMAYAFNVSYTGLHCTQGQIWQGQHSITFVSYMLNIISWRRWHAETLN